MPTMQSVHEEMKVLTEVVMANPTPREIPSKMAYLGIDKQDDLIAQIAISPPHTKIDIIAATDFQIQEINLSKPTKDTSQALATLGIKQMFTQIDKGE